MKTTPLVAASLAFVFGLALSPSSLPLGPRAADAAVIPVRPTNNTVFVAVNGRNYVLALNLRVVIAGIYPDNQLPPQPTMQCTVSLSTTDHRPVGRLPDRIPITLTQGGVSRSVVLTLVPSDVQQPIESAAFSAVMAAFDRNDLGVNASLTITDRARTRKVVMNKVPVQVVALP